MKIMIVEDNALDKELLETILDANGYDLVSIDNGHDVLPTAKSSSPDLILMDIHMAGVDGYMALELLRNNDETRDIRVIAITGNATENDRERINAAGFDDIVIKPYSIDGILETISSLSSE